MSEETTDAALDALNPQGGEQGSPFPKPTELAAGEGPSWVKSALAAKGLISKEPEPKKEQDKQEEKQVPQASESSQPKKTPADFAEERRRAKQGVDVKKLSEEAEAIRKEKEELVERLRVLEEESSRAKTLEQKLAEAEEARRIASERAEYNDRKYMDSYKPDPSAFHDVEMEEAEKNLLNTLSSIPVRYEDQNGDRKIAKRVESVIASHGERIRMSIEAYQTGIATEDADLADKAVETILTVLGAEDADVSFRNSVENAMLRSAPLLDKIKSRMQWMQENSGTLQQRVHNERREHWRGILASDENKNLINQVKEQSPELADKLEKRIDLFSEALSNVALDLPSVQGQTPEEIDQHRKYRRMIADTMNGIAELLPTALIARETFQSLVDENKELRARLEESSAMAAPPAKPDSSEGSSRGSEKELSPLAKRALEKFG